MRVLLFEDTPALRTRMAQAMRDWGWKVRSYENLGEADFRDSPDAVVTDRFLLDGDAVAAIPKWRAKGFEGPIVMMTGQADIEAAVAAMRAGADDFVATPVAPEEIRQRVESLLGARQSGSEKQESKRTEEGVWEAPLAKMAYQQLCQLAPLPVPVLLQGPTGSGKEVASRILHQRSGRNGPLVAINCAAMPEALLESELFGHRKGAFTGAERDSIGLIGEAAGGTLLLDEIGEMPLALQAKLLRVLEDGTYRPVGGGGERQADVRWVLATHRDLQEGAVEGRFRQDLYFRIASFPVRLPPLRDRLVDLPILARHLLQQAAQRFARPAPPLEEGVLAALNHYDWPGNVRELRNVMERLVVMTPPNTAPDPVMLGIPLPDPRSPAIRVGGLKAAEQEAERQAIQAALDRAGGNKAEAARVLGIGYKTLFNKMKQLGMR